MSAISREIVNAFRFEVQSNVELTNSYEYLRAENQKLQLRIAELEGQLNASDGGEKEATCCPSFDSLLKSHLQRTRESLIPSDGFVESSSNKVNAQAQSTPAIRWDEKTKTIRQAHDDSPVYFPEV